MDTNIETIKIDSDGKYILVFEFPNLDALRDNLKILEESQNLLNDWWLSNDKFSIVTVTSDVKVRVEKVGDEDSSIS